MSSFSKDPNAVLDYQVDWSGWLNGDTLATSTFAVTPVGLTIDSESNTTTVATVWLSDGNLGTTYTVTNQVTTSGGRTDERSFHVAIVDF